MEAAGALVMGSHSIEVCEFGAAAVGLPDIPESSTAGPVDRWAGARQRLGGTGRTQTRIAAATGAGAIGL
jgi:hypothetical protein